MDKMRQEFEAWVITRNVCIKYGAKLRTCPDGSYYDYRINDRWLAWKASRAALCVELPSTDTFGDEQVLFNFEDAVQIALDQAGVSYK